LPRVLAPRLDWKPTVTIAPYSEPDVARGPFRTLRRPASIGGGFASCSHPSASRPRQAVAAGPDDPRSSTPVGHGAAGGDRRARRVAPTGRGRRPGRSAQFDPGRARVGRRRPAGPVWEADATAIQVRARPARNPARSGSSTASGADPVRARVLADPVRARRPDRRQLRGRMVATVPGLGSGAGLVRMGRGGVLVLVLPGGEALMILALTNLTPADWKRIGEHF